MKLSEWLRGPVPKDDPVICVISRSGFFAIVALIALEIINRYFVGR